MTYGYIRVSTDQQDVENQKVGVVVKAEKLGMSIDEWITDDGISGTKEPEKRALGGLLNKMQNGDVIITSELSRLGRKLFMVMRILEHCMKAGVKIYTVKDNYELGDNITSKVLAFAFSLAAEIERDLISQRTKEALAKKRADGVVLGRPPGSNNKKSKLDAKADEIKKYLDAELPYSQIARLIGCHRLTVADIAKKRGWISEARERRTENISKSDYVQRQAIKNMIDVPHSNKELLQMYEDCDYSIAQMAKAIGISSGGLNGVLNRRGLLDKIRQINHLQRKTVKSNRQLKREENII